MQGNQTQHSNTENDAEKEKEKENDNDNDVDDDNENDNERIVDDSWTIRSTASTTAAEGVKNQ